MRLPGEDELDAAVLEEGAEPLRIAQEQVGALVRGGAPGEADGEGFATQLDPRSRRDLGEKLVLHLLSRRAKRAVVAVEGGGDARVLPGPAMDAVGDGDDGGGVVDTRPHRARRLSVELGH